MLAKQGQPITGPFDWVNFSKVASIEVAFLGSLAFAFLAHPGPDVLQFCEIVVVSTGATLGVLRLGDLFANVANVRSYLNNSATSGQAAYTPLPQATTLVKNGGIPSASPPTP